MRFVACSLSTLAPLWVAFGSLSLSACDNGPEPPNRVDAGGFDAQLPDTGAPVDARFDAPTFDAPGADRPDVEVQCTVNADNVFRLTTDSERRGRRVGLAVRGDEIIVAWAETRSGQPDIFTNRLSSSAELGPELPFTTTLARERDPSVAAFGAGWVIAWADNNGRDTIDPLVQRLDAERAPVGSAAVLNVTETFSEDNLLVYIGESTLVLWEEDDPVGDTRTLRGRGLDGLGAPTGSVSAATSSDLGGVVISERSSVPTLLGVENTGDRRVVLQELTSGGAAAGASTPIDTMMNGNGSIALALGGEGGAAVFGVTVSGVRQELRFRAIDEEGAVSGDERTLFEGADPALVALAGGYAVAYRVDSPEAGEVRLATIDEFGAVVDDVLVGTGEFEGGPMSMVLTSDGSLGLAWAEVHETGTDIRAAVVTCSGI